MVTGNKKYANEILDDIECYKAVLDGRLNQFPKGFWTKPWSQQSAAVITRYLLEERLKYTEEDIKTKLILGTFVENKLTSLTRVFNSSIFSVIENTYPGRFKPWELKSAPRGFWNDRNNIRDAVKWVVETKLDNNRERVCKEFNGELLRKNRLETLVAYGIYNLLEIAYPNEFKQWELKSVSNGFWSDTNNIKLAVRWLVETKLDNNRERVCRDFNTETLYENGLRELAKVGVYKALDITYPNEFKPWELSNVSPGFWEDTNNIKEVVRWLVETKLDNNRDRVCKEFNRELFNKYRISQLILQGVYNVLNMTYPNQYKPWELTAVSTGFWDSKENIRDAVSWLVETKLDNNKERVKKEFNQKLLINNGLISLINKGLYNIINIAYPNEFKVDDFRVRKKVMEQENRL